MKILRYILLASLTCALSACEKDEILPEPEPPVVTPGDDPGKDEEEKIRLGITASLQAMQTKGIIEAFLPGHEMAYAVNEALHLSDQEKEIVMDCLKKISIELEHGIDKHSKALIAMNIELLLNYCMRFYERQFITRNSANKDALTKFEQLLDEYFQDQLPIQNGLPSVKYFADKVYLSPNYFGDMVKKETGKTPQEHIQTKVIELAKERIVDTEETVSQIAYSLGFQYPQHLCRLFKRRVGCTPNEYRNQALA